MGTPSPYNHFMNTSCPATQEAFQLLHSDPVGATFKSDWYPSHQQPLDTVLQSYSLSGSASVPLHDQIFGSATDVWGMAGFDGFYLSYNTKTKYGRIKMLMLKDEELVIDVVDVIENLSILNFANVPSRFNPSKLILSLRPDMKMVGTSSENNCVTFRNDKDEL
ncbi:hypothetical protein C8Q75DRAFT_735354 [Abortiporus biennis]|nr:hypothetical protein C8Q75DRAFT_735354 [Abortiporus biennis]